MQTQPGVKMAAGGGGDDGDEDQRARARWDDAGLMLRARHPEIFESVLAMAELFAVPVGAVSHGEEEIISESYIDP